jgi:hypothetical protein
MATEDSFIQAGHGIGSRDSSRMLSVLTVNGASTVKGPITVPPGAWLNAIAIETPTTITGTPTCNVRVGTTDGGQDIVADTAAQTQGHVAATIVTAFDKVLGLVSTNTLFIQVTTSGTGGLAGTINVLVSYDPPSR